MKRKKGERVPVPFIHEVKVLHTLSLVFTEYTSVFIIYSVLTKASLCDFYNLELKEAKMGFSYTKFAACFY